jgi:hypothetical protein
VISSLDGLGEEGNPLLLRILLAEMLEQHLPHFGVVRWATVAIVFVLRDEQRHDPMDPRER